MKNIILTGERPTGRLHLGHFVGSLKNRIRYQNEGNFDKFYVMIADTQALTDNAKNTDKVSNNIIQVALDNLSVGIDPNKVCIFIQSQVPQLSEITCYLLNLVTVSRLQRNPTVKEEIKQRGFTSSIPAGFLTYPVSQASDILAFDANIVPVGDDQLPVVEQVVEIAKSFNNTYGEIFRLPKAVLPEKEVCARLMGLDGKIKMSKSANNCIYLSDDEKTVKEKIQSAYTDPNHIRVSDPGQIEGNVVFSYLDAFCEDEDFKLFLPEYENLEELKAHYKKGGLGDVKVKRFLNEVIQKTLEPIRNRRKEYEKDIDAVYEMLFENSKKACDSAQITIDKMKEKMGLNYRKFLKK